jgi:hypothetical protein
MTEPLTPPQAETIREGDLLRQLAEAGYETATLLCNLTTGAWAATCEKPQTLRTLRQMAPPRTHQTAVGRTRLRALHALVLKIEALPQLTIVPPQATDDAG